MKPTEIKLHQRSAILELKFDDDSSFELPVEYLRVYSPSAEVQGHGPGQEVLQLDKEDVNIERIEAVGHYAVKLVFSDGHESGIFSWTYLYELGTHQEDRWQHYLQRLETAGHSRKTNS